jgi:hypothetical protein
MIKALLLVLDPTATWDRIQRAQRGLFFILVLYVLPMLVLISAAEGYGLVHWGRMQFARRKYFPVNEAVVYEAAQFLLWLGVIFLGAKLIKSLGETFHGRHTFTQTFTTVAYGLSPLFLLRLLDGVSAINPWVTYSIGILLSVGALYHGVPRIMQPDPPQAFGLYLMGSILLVLTTGLARFITICYLRGKFTVVDSIVSDLAARLPFLH